jgi:hypothetical protein
VAAALRQDPTLTVELESGHYGEFTVLVEGHEVVSAGAIAMLGILPSIRAVREAVERARGQWPERPPGGT